MQHLQVMFNLINKLHIKIKGYNKMPCTQLDFMSLERYQLITV